MNRGLAGRDAMALLAGAVFETNAPTTHRLRQDIGSYVSLTAPGGRQRSSTPCAGASAAGLRPKRLG